jgi:hypothetical protein
MKNSSTSQSLTNMANKNFYYASLSDAIEKVENQDEHVVLYYHGPFNKHIIAEMSRDLREQLAYPTHLGWKVFYVFVELVQNIYFYANEHNIGDKGDPIGVVFVEDKEGVISITTGNVATLEAFEAVKDKCEYINQLPHDELRLYKNELLKKAVLDRYAKGSVGLAQIALLSQEKLLLEASLEHNDAFFCITTTIKK